MSLIQANTHLAVNLYQLLSQENENVFFSPFSISIVMGMLLCAAEGDTASEMKTTLGYDGANIEKDALASVFEQQLSFLLQPNESYNLSCANSMISRKDFQVKNEYKNILTKSFNALTLEVDFRNESEKVINLINEWVSKETNGMITDITKSLDPSTALVLLNAVYFKGTWMKQFDKESTSEEPFYNKGAEENAKQVEMMHLKESFLFYEDEVIQALQLPYMGEEIAMMIILPRGRKDLDKTESNLSPSFIRDLNIKLRKQNVNISLPRFRLEYEKSLVPYFTRLGIERAFNPGAEFTVASDSPELAVTEILHKAVLDVNEEGSEAAASTAVFVVYASDEPEFIANHPFMFMIQNTKTDFLLFMGRVNEF